MPAKKYYNDLIASFNKQILEITDQIANLN